MNRGMGPIALVLIVGTLGSPAVAHNQEKASDQRVRRHDPRDVGNRLDIARASFVGRGDGTATLSFRTRRTWGCRYINRDLVHDGSVASIRWSVNLNRDPYTERDAYFRCDQGTWTLYWVEDHDTTHTFEGSRSSRRDLSVTLPLRKLGLERRKHVAFTAITFANGKFGDDVYIEETDAASPLKPLAHSSQDR